MSSEIWVKVNSTWKQASAYYVNVNGTWKTGSEFHAKISGTWSGGGAAGGGLPSTAIIKGLDIVEFTLPTFGVIDAKAAVNSQTLDIVEFTLPAFGMEVS
jgi:hypothetical protein|tara:strand:+ start:819 stop:1118 length:300 start_codon:yes stop_codon:yes gene_type:complete